MTKNPVSPTVLVILDGIGHSEKKDHNAVYTAKTPNLDAWQKTFPHALLAASGTFVGLPEGSIGNSEVGHLTLGAGRVIKQPATLIDEAIQNGSFFSHPHLNRHLKELAASGGRLHLMGLLSDAHVHSHLEHLFAFLQAAKQNDVTKVFVHPFLDGRDTPPQSAGTYLEQLDKELVRLRLGSIASLQGRFYAMDRDNNWERTQQSYDVLVNKQNATHKNWRATLADQYEQNITDEFVPPLQLDPDGIVHNGDGVIFFNFRPDRARQLSQLFIKKDSPNRKQESLTLAFFVTPTSYASFLATDVLFEQQPIANTLPDILAKHGKRFFAVAETEKYAHVTYFFSGGQEKPLPSEQLVLIPSIPAKNYVDKPEMSAEKITTAVLTSLKTDPYDFYLINYANADMVGHSGNMQATVKAIEFLDKQLGKLYEQVVEKMDGTLYVTADHGNAEKMFDEKTQQPHTAHTTNKVPFIMVQKKLEGKPKRLPLTQLADIAPFILEHLEL